MRKHHFYILLNLSLLLSIWSCVNADKITKTDQLPNILWIIAEDLSPDLACYGYEGVLTPNLDKLAARGMRFEKAFTTAPVCAPSRSALALGMYQTSINAHHMRYPDELKNTLPTGVLPLHEVFKRNGYQTALIKDPPANKKMDWSFKTPLDEYDTYTWNDLSSDKPFFALFNMRLTHRPFERDTINPIDPAMVTLPPYYPNHKVAREDWGLYLESVQLMDGLVGQILNTLDQKGLSENTIIVFLGDHGRPMSRGKNNLYDSGMQIPLIMAAPENSKWKKTLAAGSSYQPLVSAIDICASSLAFAGIDKPEWMHGRVLFGDNKEPERTEVFCALDRIGGANHKSRAVRTSKWKYIKNYHRDISINEIASAYRKAMHPIHHLLKIYDEMGLLTPEQEALVRPLPEEELYDLENDPFEVNNLASQSDLASTMEELRNKLIDWQTATTDYGMMEDSDEIKEAFEKYRIESGKKHKAKIAKRDQTVRQIIASEK